jgi:nicotinamidase-related amidase
MKKALLIIDIQNDYFEHGTMTLSGSVTASDNAKKLLETFRNETLPVIHVQHLATRPTATFFLPGTKGAQIHNSVKPLDTEKVIVKHYPNSFRETELLEYLTKNDITDLVICGMMTHMCIDATVRAAKDFGFSITIPGDACATKDLDVNGQIVRADQVQTSFLAALNYFYASVTTTVEYLSSMAT